MSDELVEIEPTTLLERVMHGGPPMVWAWLLIVILFVYFAGYTLVRIRRRESINRAVSFFPVPAIIGMISCSLQLWEFCQALISPGLGPSSVALILIIRDTLEVVLAGGVASLILYLLTGVQRVRAKKPLKEQGGS